MIRTYNEITDYLDQFLIQSNYPYEDDNYIVGYGKAPNDPYTYIYLIRTPGETRGCIRLNETYDIISHIEIYGDFPDTYCYAEPYDVLTKKLQDKFIGMKWSDLRHRIKS